MTRVVMAIDQGTTGTTVLLIDGSGQVVSRGYSEFTQHYPQPGWVEHDAEEIWRVTQRVMKEALDAGGLGAASVAAIGITNQRETTVVWDRETGKPIARAIVWQCRRTADICRALKTAGLEPKFREKTGLLLDAYFSGTKVRWLLEHTPEAAGRARDGRLAFGTIDSWLLWNLTAGQVHATDFTNASRTLLFDIHAKCWAPDLCDALGVPASMLPAVHPSAHRFGTTAASAFFGCEVPVSGIAGDQQAALFGQGCWEAGMAKNTYGTGCFLLMNTGQISRPSQKGLLTTLCAGKSGEPLYALEGSVFIAGAAIQWLRDSLGAIAKASETQAIAESVPDTGGVYFVPAFVGLGAPHWNMEARGAILGLTRGSGRAHIVRAALESIAYQSHDLVGLMVEESGVPIRELRVDGGACANDFLMQFQSDLLGIPVDRPANVETTALGAAYLAGLAEGFWNGAEELAHVRATDRTFRPAMPDAQRRALTDGWRRAVTRVL